MEKNLSIEKKSSIPATEFDILASVSSYGDGTRGYFSGTFKYWVSDVGYLVVKKSNGKYYVYHLPGTPGVWIHNRESCWLATVAVA